MADGDVVYGELTFTERSFRDDIERAMGTDIMRALVELITNADDSYERAGVGGEIVVTVQRRGKSQRFPVLMVGDTAEGMTREEMNDRLGTVGKATSGFLDGARVRGLFGRGGTDAVHFGPISWKSWKAGEHSSFEIIYEGGATARTRSTALRSAGPRKHGTLVKLEVQRKVTIPRQSTLITRLSRHYALRPILLDRKRRKVLVNAALGGKTERLSYPMPPGAPLVTEQVLDIPGYPGQTVTVSLSEAPASLLDSERQQYWRHSLLITSHRAAYDVFGGGVFAREPDSLHLSKLFGTADVPGISDLIRDHDERAAQKLDPTEDNPIRLVSRDRDGLVERDQHPFVDALYTALEEALLPQIERLRAESARTTRSEVSNDLRKRLRDAERVVAEFMRETEQEPGDGGEIEGVSRQAGLTVIPSRRVAEPDKPAQLVIRYRPTAASRSSVSSSTRSDGPTVTVRVTKDGSVADPIKMSLVNRGDYYSRSIKLAPCVEGTVAQVAVSHDVEKAHGVVVWEHREVPPVDELSFNHERYTIRDGGRRTAYLYAPWDLVAKSDDRPVLELKGDSGIQLPHELHEFAFDRTRQAAVCTIVLTGSGVGSRARIWGSYAAQAASARVEVTARGIEGVNVDFVERPDIPLRGWFSADRSTVLINTKSRVVERYIGTKADGLPHQDTVVGRMVLAEVLSAIVVRDVLTQRQDQQLSPNDLFYEYETQMAKLLPRLHNAFVSARELRVEQRNDDAGL